MAKSLGADYWQKHVEAWKQSGLTQAAYCNEQGIKRKTFYHWRSKSQASSTEHQGRALTLVPVSVGLAMPTQRIELHSPGGWRIELTDSNPAWLADLLKQLP
jgi:hypothetical protein